MQHQYGKHKQDVFVLLQKQPRLRMCNLINQNHFYVVVYTDSN